MADMLPSFSPTVALREWVDRHICTPIRVIVTGSRFQVLHNDVSKCALNMDVRVTTDARSPLCGLHHDCSSKILPHMTGLVEVLMQLVFTAHAMQVPLHLYCTSGRHRSVAVAEWLVRLVPATTYYVTLPLAASQHEGAFPEQFAHGREANYVISGFSTLMAPVVSADTYNAATNAVVQQLTTPGGGASKGARRRANQRAYRFVDFLSWNIPEAAQFEVIKPDFIGQNTFKLVDCSPLPIPQGYFTIAEGELTVVGGSCGEQMKHLKYFQHSDSTSVESFSHLKQDLEQIMKDTITEVDDIYLDTATLNSASSAGLELADLGFNRKGECVPQIEAQAREKLRLIKQNLAPAPGVQTPGGRGKRLSMKKFQESSTTAALGRLIRIRSEEHI